MSLTDRLRAARDTAAATPLPPGRPHLVLIVSDRDPHGRTVTREPMLPMRESQTDRDAALPAWRRRDLSKDFTGGVRS